MDNLEYKTSMSLWSTLVRVKDNLYMYKHAYYRKQPWINKIIEDSYYVKTANTLRRINCYK